MEEITGLLSAIALLAWPLIVMMLVGLFWKPAKELLESWSSKKMTIKVGSTEISFDEYSQQAGNVVSDLQTQVIHLQEEVEELKGDTSETLRTKRTSRVLWVDDFPENHVYLVQKLQEVGIGVSTALSTRSALTQLANASFDVVITDMHRKEDGESRGQAGIELTNELRKMNTDIPIIFYFGRNRRSADQYRTIASQAGANLVTSSPTALFRFLNIEERE